MSERMVLSTNSFEIWWHAMIMYGLSCEWFLTIPVTMCLQLSLWFPAFPCTVIRKVFADKGRRRAPNQFNRNQGSCQFCQQRENSRGEFTQRIYAETCAEKSGITQMDTGRKYTEKGQKKSRHPPMYPSRNSPVYTKQLCIFDMNINWLYNDLGVVTEDRKLKLYVRYRAYTCGDASTLS